MPKVNIYIAYADADKGRLNTLLEWLHPMKDEVNIWYRNPPANLPSLALPWRILLFWYRPPNYMAEYFRVLEQQKLRAHLYFFLASPAALEDARVLKEIGIANQRKTAGDWRSPRLFRLVAGKCNWQAHQPWKALAALEPEVVLASAQRREWIQVVEAIDFHVKFIQPILREVRFYQGRPVSEDVYNPQGLDDIPLPDLNDDPASVTFETPSVSYPPAWAGWLVLVLIILAGGRSLTSERARVRTDIHLDARPAKEYQVEYPRENPYRPPADTAVVWPPAD